MKQTKPSEVRMPCCTAMGCAKCSRTAGSVLLSMGQIWISRDEWYDLQMYDESSADTCLQRPDLHHDSIISTAYKNFTLQFISQMWCPILPTCWSFSSARSLRSLGLWDWHTDTMNLPMALSQSLQAIKSLKVWDHFCKPFWLGYSLSTLNGILRLYIFA